MPSAGHDGRSGTGAAAANDPAAPPLPLSLSNDTIPDRVARLHALARNYVTDAQGKGDFDAILYAEDVTLLAPLCPGGSAQPLHGRDALLAVATVIALLRASRPGLDGKVRADGL